METEELKKIYREYFQSIMKASESYKEKFNNSVNYLNEYLKEVTQEEKNKIGDIIDNFIEAEDQMLEDTFVNAVKYSYKVFHEIKD